MHTVVFCDFDGTVTSRDVGYHLFHHFSNGRNEPLVRKWKAGTLSSRDCLQQEAALIRTTAGEVFAYLDTFELTRGFPEFEERCRLSGVPLIIASDGLDLYIEHILKRYGLSRIPVLCNIGRVRDGAVEIEFPYPLGACGRCGNCKGERIAEYRGSRAEDVEVVFIGDGLSDTCAIDQADLLFAKKDLARYCEANNIAYTTFDTFCDITRVLTEQGRLIG